MSDFMAIAIKRPCKGSTSNDCLHKDLPCQINIRRQDKELVIIRRIGAQSQQVIGIGDLVWVVRLAGAAAVFGFSGCTYQ